MPTLTGSERLVLLVCHDLGGGEQGFVLDAAIAQRTGMGLKLVQDCLRGLDGEGHVELVPVEGGHFKASVSPKGRQELVKDEKGVEKSTPVLGEKSPIRVVPKGLRSFDEHDADFFLELLPGPRRSDGLPESVHFWKVRIEEMDPDKTFRVGVIFGPSGCGKSSLVKAGLLPRLADHVRSVC